MDDNARAEKNRTIRENGKTTRLRHSSMRPLVVEMKLDLKCLNNSERVRETICGRISPSAAGFAIILSLLMLMHSDLSTPEQGISHHSTKTATL